MAIHYDKIQLWLTDSGSLADGLALLSACPGVNVRMLQTLGKSDTAKNRDKVKYELKKALNTFPNGGTQKTAVPVKNDMPARVAVVAKTEQEREKKQAVLFHQLPPQLRPVLLEANATFKENCMLKAALNDLPPLKEKQALQLQLKIFSNIQKNRLCWRRIDYYLTHQKMMPIAAPLAKADSLSPAQQYKRQDNLFSSISRLKKRITINKAQFDIETSLPVKNRLEKAILRAEANLQNKEEELLTLTTLIDGHTADEHKAG